MNFFSEAFSWFANLSSKLPQIDFKTYFIVVVALLSGVGLIVALTFFGTYRFKLTRACRRIIRYLAGVEFIDDDNVSDFTAQCFSNKAPSVLRDSWVQYLGVRFGYPSEIVSEQNVYDSQIKRVREIRANVYIAIALVLIAAFSFWGYGTLDGKDMGVIFLAGLLLSGVIYLVLVIINKTQSKTCLNTLSEMQEDLDAKVILQVEKTFATDASPLTELSAIVDEIVARNTAKDIGFDSGDEETPIEMLIAQSPEMQMHAVEVPVDEEGVEVFDDDILQFEDIEIEEEAQEDTPAIEAESVEEESVEEVEEKFEEEYNDSVEVEDGAETEDIAEEEAVVEEPVEDVEPESDEISEEEQEEAIDGQVEGVTEEIADVEDVVEEAEEGSEVSDEAEEPAEEEIDVQEQIEEFDGELDDDKSEDGGHEEEEPDEDVHGEGEDKASDEDSDASEGTDVYNEPVEDEEKEEPASDEETGDGVEEVEAEEQATDAGQVDEEEQPDVEEQSDEEEADAVEEEQTAAEDVAEPPREEPEEEDVKDEPIEKEPEEEAVEDEPANEPAEEAKEEEAEEAKEAAGDVAESDKRKKVIMVSDYADDEETVKPAKLVKLPNLIDYMLSRNPSRKVMMNLAMMLLGAYKKFEHSPEDKRIVIGCMKKVMFALQSNR